MAIRSAIKRFIGKVKENYNYYKMGRKAEFDEEMARMKQEAVKRGLHDPEKEEMFRKKIKKGEGI